MTLYYPMSVHDKELAEHKLLFEYKINSLLYNILSKTDNDIPKEDFINSIVSSIEGLDEVEYIGTSYLGNDYYFPGDKYSFAEIDSFPVNEVIFKNDKNILALSIPVKDKKWVGEINIKVGIDATKIVLSEKAARYQSFVLLLISAILIYLFVFFFDRVVYIPFKKLIHLSKLVSIGQESLEEHSGMSTEFNRVVGYLEVAAKRMAELRQDNKMIPLNLRKSQQKAEQIQKNLDKELEAMSNLVIYMLELRKEKTKKGIFDNLVKEITSSLGYSVSFLFKYENSKLIFDSSSLKGLSVLDEKIKFDLKNFIIADQNYIVQKMQSHYPLIREELPFNDIMLKYNLAGKFALIPINTAFHFYGMVIIGNLGEKKSIEHKDLEKLMLLANTVALHLENIDNVQNLERSVKQRTEELEITNKLLSDSIIEKDIMLKLVSHDLNAPLRNVIGLVESIERKYKDDLDGDLNDRLLRIRKNVEKELNMIEEILTNFKSSKNIGLKEPVNISVLISSILDELTYELKRKNVKVEIDKNLPVLLSNEAVLKHIFLNLIDNACKYMPIKKRSNKIKILSNIEEEFLVFQVTDNGPGIPPEKQVNVFDSYQRGNNSPDQSGGKGLGLALVKNMVGKIGGEIHLQSKVGKGTSFFIKFNNYQIN
ncbi:MAG: HAMP domain-containing histidine kinase [Calditrichaeota bacterium]|nr:HAMP domain-containing histidine kinase [Calditrichota bacterium]